MGLIKTSILSGTAFAIARDFNKKRQGGQESHQHCQCNSHVGSPPQQHYQNQQYANPQYTNQQYASPQYGNQQHANQQYANQQPADQQRAPHQQPSPPAYYSNGQESNAREQK